MKELKNISDEKLLNEVLNKGGVIAFVTDTVWGLGCLPDNEMAVAKIYDIKGRDRSKPLILMSNELEYLLGYIKENQFVKNMAEKYFPGALTIVSEKSEKVKNYVTSNKNTVGIRVPDNLFFKELCSRIEGHVLATTSANLSNRPASKNYIEAKSSIGGLVDIIFDDYGYCAKGIESTVISITPEGTCNILRKGAIDINL